MTVHDGGPAQEVPPEVNALWLQDNVTLSSVGIDIGSSGTQVVFSEVRLRRSGEALQSRFDVVGRETLYLSPVTFTPYLDDLTIDAEALGRILDAAYAGAGIDASNVDTGVVILTGEALRRRNARQIADVVAARAGDLVCAAAGHHMEATIAAHGSGAVELSRDGSRLLNVDIGGGTTKLALVENGDVLQTAALRVGGRLMAHSLGKVVRLEPGGQRLAARAGVDWVVGSPLRPSDLWSVAELMAEIVLRATSTTGPTVDADLYLTPPLSHDRPLDGIVFSGGVAEFVYQREQRQLGDLGFHLGAAIVKRLASAKASAHVIDAGAGIRATVVGASEFTVQLSGSTSFVDEVALPARNLRVVRPSYVLGPEIEPMAVASALQHALPEGSPSSDDGIAVALSWSGDPVYARLRAFAEGIIGGFESGGPDTRPVYMLVDADIARSLGHLLIDELGLRRPLVVLDGLTVGDLDFVDLGNQRLPSSAVPVTVKSLVFDDLQGRIGQSRPGRSGSTHQAEATARLNR